VCGSSRRRGGDGFASEVLPPPLPQRARQRPWPALSKEASGRRNRPAAIGHSVGFLGWIFVRRKMIAEGEPSYLALYPLFIRNGL